MLRNQPCFVMVDRFFWGGGEINCWSKCAESCEKRLKSIEDVTKVLQGGICCGKNIWEKWKNQRFSVASFRYSFTSTRYSQILFTMMRKFLLLLSISWIVGIMTKYMFDFICKTKLSKTVVLKKFTQWSLGFKIQPCFVYFKFFWNNYIIK